MSGRLTHMPFCASRGPLLEVMPETTTNSERVRVIVAYVEARPERMKDGFGLPANEVMAKAWPCKK